VFVVGHPFYGNITRETSNAKKEFDGGDCPDKGNLLGKRRRKNITLKCDPGARRSRGNDRSVSKKLMKNGWADRERLRGHEGKLRGKRSPRVGGILEKERTLKSPLKW